MAGEPLTLPTCSCPRESWKLPAATEHEQRSCWRDADVQAKCTPGATAHRAGQPAVAVISGGSACNHVVDDLLAWTRDVSFILPITDDGGSTREILRVFGGPSVGDFRSRLTKLLRFHTPDGVSAVADLLEHRLSGHPCKAQEEFNELADGSSSRYQGIPADWQASMREALLTCSRVTDLEPQLRFNFRGACVGNLVLTGMRLATESFPEAIARWAALAGIPPQTRVLPSAHCCERPVTIGAELADGSCIMGQDNLSHPHQQGESTKAGSDFPLPAALQRIFYVDGRDCARLATPPEACAQATAALRTADVVVYSMGSLYTSLAPSLMLKGVGHAIREGKHKKKVLLLNSRNDRETRWFDSAGDLHEYTAEDHVLAVARALHGYDNVVPFCPSMVRHYVTDVFCARAGLVPGGDCLPSYGVTLHRVDSRPCDNGEPGERRMVPRALVKQLQNLMSQRRGRNRRRWPPPWARRRRPRAS